LECVRVKRGLVDTARPGGFAKDQAAWDGLVRIHVAFSSRERHFTSLLSIFHCHHLQIGATFVVIEPSGLNQRTQQLPARILHLRRVKCPPIKLVVGPRSVFSFIGTKFPSPGCTHARSRSKIWSPRPQISEVQATVISPAIFHRGGSCVAGRTGPRDRPCGTWGGASVLCP